MSSIFNILLKKHDDYEMDHQLILQGKGPVYLVHPVDAKGMALIHAADFKCVEGHSFKVCDKDTLPTAYSTTLYWIIYNFNFNGSYNADD